MTEFDQKAAYGHGYRQKLGFAALFLALFVLSYNGYGMSGFKFSHWLFTYDFGFSKRALLGSVLQLLWGPPTMGLVLACSYAALVLLATMLLYVFYRPYRRHGLPGLGWFFVFCALSPATIQSLHFDLGRFDTISYAIVLLAIAVMSRSGEGIRRCTVFFALCLVMLIHEANFVMFAPMIFGYWLYLDPADASVNFRRGLLAAALAALLVLVSTLGVITAISMDDYVRHLQPLLPAGFDGQAAAVLFTDVDGSLALAANEGLTLGRLFQHALAAPVILVTLFMVHACLKDYFRQMSRARAEHVVRILFLLSALSPLALYPLGHDHFRWWSIAITNLLVVTATMSAEPAFASSVARVFLASRRLLLASLVLFAVVGPFCITRAYGRYQLARPLMVEYLGVREDQSMRDFIREKYFPAQSD